MKQDCFGESGFNADFADCEIAQHEWIHHCTKEEHTKGKTRTYVFLSYKGRNVFNLMKTINERQLDDTDNMKYPCMKCGLKSLLAFICLPWKLYHGNYDNLAFESWQIGM